MTNVAPQDYEMVLCRMQIFELHWTGYRFAIVNVYF